MASLLAQSVRETLRETFPHTVIKEEFYAPYKSTKLYFDFFLPSLSIAVEVQGQQHFGFNKYFHGDANAYKQAKLRDSLKQEWAQENEVTLVAVDFDEIPISREGLLEKIRGIQQNG